MEALACFCCPVRNHSSREAPPQTAQTGGYGRVELTAGAPSRRRHGRWAVIDVTGSESVAVVEIPPVATAAQMVAGHITLDISCLDRLYLTGFVAKLQTPGGVIYFLHDHRGQPIASPALFEPIGAKFRKDMTDWAQANGVPVVRFKAGDRKVEVMRPYLEQAAAVGGSKVVAIGRAQEFASVWTATRRDDDPAALQAICDTFTAGTAKVWFERWMAKLPLPLTNTDRDAGFWWDLSMRQIETSRTLVFDDDCHARAFFEALLADNMDLGRPENVELLFRRGTRAGRPTHPPAGGFKTKIDRYCDLVTLNVFYKNSRCKQYLKDGVALRIETVVNDARDLRCNRLLTNLDELQAKARAINNQLLETETVGQGTALVSPVIERITKPTVNEG